MRKKILTLMAAAMAGMSASAQVYNVYKSDGTLEKSYGDTCIIKMAKAKPVAPTISLSRHTVGMRQTGKDGNANTITLTADASDGATVTWSSSATDVATVENGTVTANGSGKTLIIVTAKSATNGMTTKDTCRIDVDYVDMGTSAGKWAVCNLGAYFDTEIGDYYAWGATTKWYESVSWSGLTPTFTWKDDYSDGYSQKNAPNYSSSAYTKYTDSDSKTTLETGDDAAYTNWGSSWRMPTGDEFMSLVDACTTTSGDYYTTTHIESSSTSKDVSKKGIYFIDANAISDYSVAGLLFNNGTDKVFFPAAGFMNGTSLDYAGQSGRYWSSSLRSSNTPEAYILYFYSDLVNPFEVNSRYYGLTVRPVSD